MRGSLAPESIITNLLRDLGCGGRHAVDIARACGISVSQGGFSEVMNEKKNFTPETANRMLALLAEMKALEHDVKTLAAKLPPNVANLVFIDWSKANKIAETLAIRRFAVIEPSFDTFASEATQEVAHVS